MKRLFPALFAITLILASCSSVSSKKIGTKELSFNGLRDSVSYVMGVNIGYNALRRNNFGRLNPDLFEKGVEDAMNAKGSPNDTSFFKQFMVDPSESDIIDRFIEHRNEVLLAENKDKEDKFLAENKTKEGVVALESRLQYKLIEPGNGNRPSSNQDTVSVRYKGMTLDGTVFDELGADQDPVEFALDQVIPAWSEGMKYVGEGGRIILYAPADLAYGERGNHGIEPNATLIFDVELVKVSKYVPPVADE